MYICETSPSLLYDHTAAPKKASLMPKITPFPWFDHQAEEATNFCRFVFKNSNEGRVSRYGDAGPAPKAAP